MKRAAFLIRNVGAAHGNRKEPGKNERTKELRIRFTQQSFRELNQQDLLPVHDVPEIHGAAGLADDWANYGVVGEGVQLTGDVGCDVGEGRLPAGLFSDFLPEADDDGVPAAPKEELPVCLALIAQGNAEI